VVLLCLVHRRHEVRRGLCLSFVQDVLQAHGFVGVRGVVVAEVACPPTVHLVERIGDVSAVMLLEMGLVNCLQMDLYAVEEAPRLCEVLAQDLGPGGFVQPPTRPRPGP
jgi:hypothetical protein